MVDGLEPWGGVRAVWAFGSPQSTHAVDTTDTFDAGVVLARLRQHAPLCREPPRAGGVARLGNPRLTCWR